MRVVLQSGSRVFGGNEKWLLTVARGLAARGHVVVISSPAGQLHDRARSAGVSVTAHRPHAFEPVTWLDFAAWLRRWRADTILLSRWSDKLAVALAGRAAGVPRIALRLGIARPLRLGAARAALFRRAIDDVIVNSTEIEELVAASAPWYPPERVHVVHNAVEPPAIDESRRIALRAEMGAGPETHLIIGAGHAARRKGFDILLQSYARARAERTRVAIVGDGPELEELRRLASRLGIAEEVSFLGRRPDAAELIAASDLFVLSSRNEGMANVLLEAMAAGVPIISTNVSGARESIGAREGRAAAGVIVPPDDVDAMAIALAEVASARRARDDGVAARVEEGRWRARHWFGAERMLDDVERVLRGSSRG